MKRKVEVFTAGCPVCNPVVQLVKSVACENCEVIVYDVVQQCETKECLMAVQNYGIKQLPAVVVNGELLDCCKNKGVTKEALINAGVGQ